MTKNQTKGFNEERFLSERIKERFPEFNIKNNHTHGVDIILEIPRESKKIKIEVKSCNAQIRDGKYLRSGRFHFQTASLERPDYFCFIVKHFNKRKTYWVKKEEILKYFSTRKKDTRQVGIAFSTFRQKIKKTSFYSVINEL